MASLFDATLVVVSRGERSVGVAEKRALAEMRARLERLRGLSAEFSSVELSPYVRGLLGRPRAAVAEPARRAAGI